MKRFKELTEELFTEGGEMYPADEMTMKEVKIACYAANNILDRLESGAMIQRWQISAIVKASEELASVYTSMSADEVDMDDEWEDEEPMYVGFEYPRMYGEETELDEAVDYDKMTTAELKAAANSAIKSGDRNAVKAITSAANKRIANKGGTPVTKLTTDPKKLDALKKQLHGIKKEETELNEAASFESVLKAHKYSGTGKNYTGIGGTKVTHYGDHVVSYNEADGRKVHKTASSLNKHLNLLHDHEVSLKSLKEEQIDEISIEKVQKVRDRAAQRVALSVGKTEKDPETGLNRYIPATDDEMELAKRGMKSFSKASSAITRKSKLKK